MALQITSFHTRSVSLPSPSHPLNASIEDQLRRISASQAGPSSSSSLCGNLCSVKDLYEQMNDLVHLPHNQTIRRSEVEELLDGSLALLDVSTSTLDALSMMKESILDLQSALRRGNHSEGIHAYLMSRKKISKSLSKCHVSLKKAEKSCVLAQPETDDLNMRMVKEAELISLSTLKSVISYVMGKKAISQTRGWSLVSKLVKSKNAFHGAGNATEVEEVDRSLSALSEKHSGGETKAVLTQLETLEMAVHELEDGLESVSRCFVKTRVSLLNVLDH